MFSANSNLEEHFMTETLTHAWQTIKDNAAPFVATGLAVTTSISLYAFGGSSTASAVDHEKTEQWAAWMAANITEAMNTGSNATLAYVYDQMGKMQEHCVATAAANSASATVQNIFGSVFLLAAAGYVGYETYNYVSKRRSGYTSA